MFRLCSSPIAHTLVRACHLNVDWNVDLWSNLSFWDKLGRTEGILQAVLIVVAGGIHPQYCMVTIALTLQEAVVVSCQSVC